ncbi:MAG: hypothetical protein HC830_08935 [Bacteroidetes bacterium]|nr:hypothetical protein [Bacteroidota bacterium]
MKSEAEARHFYEQVLHDQLQPLEAYRIKKSEKYKNTVLVSFMFFSFDYHFYFYFGTGFFYRFPDFAGYHWFVNTNYRIP